MKMKSQKTSRIRNVGVGLLSTLTFLASCVPIKPVLDIRIDEYTYKHMNPKTTVVFDIYASPGCTVKIDYDNDGTYDDKKRVDIGAEVSHIYDKGTHTAVFKCEGSDLEKRVSFEVRPYTTKEAFELFKERLESWYDKTMESSGTIDYVTPNGSKVKIPYLGKFEDPREVLAPKGIGIVLDNKVVEEKNLEQIISSDEFPYSPFIIRENMWKYQIDQELDKYLY